MTLSINHGDVLEAKADALVLTIDGARKGIEGNIARLFARRWPNVWDEVEDELSYPLPFGHVFDYQPVAECPLKLLLIAATLPHAGDLSGQYLGSVVRSAVEEAILRSADYGIDNVAAAIMVGGWRLKYDRAFLAMAEGYESVMSRMPKVPDLTICIQEQNHYSHIKNLAESLGWK